MVKSEALSPTPPAPFFPAGAVQRIIDENFPGNDGVPRPLQDLMERAPLALRSPDGAQAQLITRVASFPTLITEKGTNYQTTTLSHTVSIMPEEGAAPIAGVETVEKQHTCALNSVKVTPEGAVFEMGNGSWRLEVNYAFDGKKQAEPLSPPAGYKTTFELDPEAYSD